MKLLIANRGEIAIRIARAAADLGIPTVAVYSTDDARSLHVTKADSAVQLPGSGARAYLDAGAIVDVALAEGCTLVHPGYGFLSENADFATACQAAGLKFVGPSPALLALFGDKGTARRHAHEHGVPTVPGISTAVTEDDARAFFQGLPAGSRMVIKAIAGGGGRGMRVVDAAEEISDAFARASSEARAAFGNGAVYVEQFVAEARHIEVQIAADGAGSVVHLGTRDCTVQRRHQKLVEIAPAPFLPQAIREAMQNDAVRLAEVAGYESLGTFEFLYEPARNAFYFIEANARLQVEHTVTEAVFGVDLVQTQLAIAQGRTLAELGLADIGAQPPRGHAIQCRVNMETMQADGSTRPSGGTLTAFDVPSGPGIRTDTFGYSGYTTNPSFDSLLAKVIVHTRGDFAAALRAADRALADFRIEGLETNIGFLRAIVTHPALPALAVHTRFVDTCMAELLSGIPREVRHFVAERASATGKAGVKVDAVDPLAVLDYGKSASAAPKSSAGRAGSHAGPAGTDALVAPMQGTLVSVSISSGDAVRPGQVVMIMEAMKMEHEIRATTGGVVKEVTVAEGDTVFAEHPLAYVEPRADLAQAETTTVEEDLDLIRPDVAEVIERHEITLDAARPDAVAKRRKTGQRTARENIGQLCDAGSFTEHGQLVLTPGTGLAHGGSDPQVPHGRHGDRRRDGKRRAFRAGERPHGRHGL
ncbi:MAG: biotin carboxylase N-terminal domain-containing protein [Pseudomonadales bacterium]